MTHTIEEIVSRLTRAECQHAYYSAYEDAIAKEDRAFWAGEIAECKGLLAKRMEQVVAMRQIVADIANSHHYDRTYRADGERFCRYCDALAEEHWDEDAGSNRFADIEIVHEDDCIALRAMRLMGVG
jgi:hypothetical protein